MDLNDYVLIEDSSARLAYTCEDRPRIYFTSLFPICAFIFGSVMIAIRPTLETSFIMLVPLLCFILFLCLWKMDKIWVGFDIAGKKIHVVERRWLDRQKHVNDIQFEEIKEIIIPWRRLNCVIVVTNDDQSIRIFFSSKAHVLTVKTHVVALLRGDEVAGNLQLALEAVDEKERAKDRLGKICCGILFGCLILVFLLLIWNELAF